MNGEPIARAEGRSKKEAAQAAAKQALEILDVLSQESGVRTQESDRVSDPDVLTPVS